MYNIKIILFLTALFIVGCDSTSPPPNGGNEKKEFIWSEEKIPGGEAVVPTGIWGSSPNDLWVVGWKESQKGTILHFGGEKWEDVTPELGLSDIYYCIYGFSPQNIYVGGYKWFFIDDKIYLSAIILHYDGTSWTVEVDDVRNNGTIRSIHGNSSENIWAAGDRGTIYQYNGVNWQRKDYPDTMHTTSIMCLSNEQTYFLNEYNNYPINSGWKRLYFTKYSNNGWEHIDSCKLVQDKNYNYTGYRFGDKSIWGESIDKLFTSGIAIFKFRSTGWETETWGDYKFNDLKGSSWRNVFAVANHGTIHHFNGETWVAIDNYSKTIVDFYAVMPFEKSVFLLGYFERNIYLINGELK